MLAMKLLLTLGLLFLGLVGISWCQDDIPPPLGVDMTLYETDETFSFFLQAEDCHFDKSLEGYAFYTSDPDGIYFCPYSDCNTTCDGFTFNTNEAESSANCNGRFYTVKVKVLDQATPVWMALYSNPSCSNNPIFEDSLTSSSCLFSPQHSSYVTAGAFIPDDNSANQYYYTTGCEESCTNCNNFGWVDLGACNSISNEIGVVVVGSAPPTDHGDSYTTLFIISIAINGATLLLVFLAFALGVGMVTRTLSTRRTRPYEQILNNVST